MKEIKKSYKYKQGRKRFEIEASRLRIEKIKELKLKTQMNWLMSRLDTGQKICKLENIFKRLAKCGHKELENIKEREVLRDVEDTVTFLNAF